MSSRSAYCYCVICPATESFDAHLDEALSGLGFVRCAELAGATARLYRSESSDEVVLTFERGDRRLRSLPRALLARALGSTVRVYGRTRGAAVKTHARA
jgi:hypothetical protein